MNINELQSKTIDYLRFPLILGVILVHSYSRSTYINGFEVLLSEKLPVNFIVQTLFSKVIGMFCVPVFFFMSGFLFFLNNKMDFKSYENKIKNRIKTLFIPYLFWNAFVLFIYFIAQSIPSISSFVNQPLIRNFSLHDYINAFWGFDDGKPVAYQFWFIRDLFIISLLTPILKQMLFYSKYFGVTILGIIWFLNSLIIVPEHILTTIFFFTFGAYFSYYRISFISFFRKKFFFITIAYPIIATFDLFTDNMIYNPYIHNLNIIGGVIFCFNTISFFIEKGLIQNKKNLSQASFLIFAMHEPLLALIRKILFKILSPNSEQMLLAIYFIGMILTTYIILLIYNSLKKYFPSTLQLITGKR